MNTHSFKTFSLFYFLLMVGHVSLVHASQIHTLFMGSIQFPHSLETIPDLRIYCGGHKIACENGKNNRTSFAIRGERQRTTFYLLITKTIAYDTIEKNTIRHLTISPSQPYKFYRLTLYAQEPSLFDEAPKNQKPTYTWNIQEQRLPFKNRIPDDAIIICYNPEYVDSIEGGNAIELPTIHIKSDIVDLVGSENMLHEKSVELLLSSLDHDALHATIKQELKHDQKTIIAVTIS